MMRISNLKSYRLVGLTALAMVLGLGFTPALSAQTSCTHYASPTGSGNGLSSSSPFLISKFWAVAKPGSTLCLLDGTYTGPNSMIHPSTNLSGTAASRITIRAVNDGAALIDGGNALIPVLFDANDYWTLEGFNAANSSADVVAIFPGSDNNIIRRVVGWNAEPTSNSMIFSVWAGDHNLFEDVAGFGTGRKIFQPYMSDGTTFRRAWGMWNNSTSTSGPKVVVTNYSSYNSTFENMIGTFNPDPGVPTLDWYGILTANQMTGANSGIVSNTKFLGSIAYSLASQTTAAFNGALQGGGWVDGITYKDVAVYIATANNTTSLINLDPSLGPATSHNFSHITEVRTAGPSQIRESDWAGSNNESVSSVANASNIWNGSSANGARVCYQYKDGALTSTPLWPWPMNQRIMDGLKAAGRNPIDVTKTMESAFGTIPATCKTSTTTTISAPENLRVTSSN